MAGALMSDPGFEDELREALGGGSTYRAGSGLAQARGLEPMSGGVVNERLPVTGEKRSDVIRVDDYLAGQDAFQNELRGVLSAAKHSPPEPQAPAPAPAPAPQPSMLDRFLETGSDAIRGLNSGLYWGGSDEIEALSPNRTVEQARAANLEAEQRSPWAYNMSKAAGYVPGAVLTAARGAGAAAAAAGKGIGALGRIGVSAAQGLGSGALESNSDDAGEVAADAARGGAWGLGGGVAGEAVAAGAGALARGSTRIGEGLRTANAMPSGTAELEAMRRQDGIDYMQHGPTEAMRDLGLLDSWKPQSAPTHQSIAMRPNSPRLKPRISVIQTGPSMPTPGIPTTCMITKRRTTGRITGSRHA